MTEHKKAADSKDEPKEKNEELKPESAEGESKPSEVEPNESQLEITTDEDADKTEPKSKEAEETKADDLTPFDDEKTDQAIDDIVATESDELLAAQDAATGKTVPKKRRNFFVRWWQNKWARWITILIILGGVGAALAIPTARYWVLNTLGVRSSVSVIVVDSTTQLPLKGAQFTVAGQTGTTDSEGQAQVSDIKLGPQQMKISQIGFAEVQQNITVGWGSNPLGTVALKAAGIQYAIEVRDYLSEKPIEGVEASSGESSARSDKNGLITLTLPTTVVAKDSITLSMSGYRSEQISLGADPTVSTKAAMVIARKAVFVTKQSGKYDLYKSDIDGKNRQLLLPGTGKENSNIGLAVSPDGTRAALVSVRDGKQDSSGFLLSSLVLVDTSTGDAITIAEGPHIRLIDWIGTRLVFEQVSSDPGAANRSTVTAYNFADNSRVQLASANKLVAVTSAQSFIYYAVAAGDPSVPVGLYKIASDGNGKQRIFENDIMTLLRTDYNTFAFQATAGSWSSYSITSGAVVEVAAPASAASRNYIDNADRTKSLWLQQGSLKSYDIASKQDTVVGTQSGLAYPLQWLTASAAIYRVANGGEIADYAFSLDGGVPRKISDVASTYGFGQTP